MHPEHYTDLDNLKHRNTTCATPRKGVTTLTTSPTPSHLENARTLRGIYFIDPEDKKFKETIKNARKKLETSVAPAISLTNLVLDNGHLLDQVLKRSGILPRIVHKEPGKTLRNKCCWNLQKVDILFSVQQLHCPGVLSKARSEENCLYTSLQM